MDKSRDSIYVSVVPSARQLEHQKMEMYAFFHYSMNTYTGREWGDGSEDPSLFNPTELDPSQWARAIKAAGMTGAILTCKHHDGFCMWPSRYTEHSVKNSPYKGGKGDVVREVADAMRAEGLKFGIYLSPWDRNNETYGTGEAYDDYYVNQLEELLTGYGDIFAVWMDGACGEGANGKKQYYDWNRYYEVIRRLQPNACICICGEDVRWCGNEAGIVRPSEWNVLPRDLANAEKVAAKSQQTDDDSFRQRKLSSSEEDLGSREKLKNEDDLIWYPSEVDTSIRPGWFYHKEEDNKVKSVNELVSIYENSVGGNCTLLLNIPPMPSGLLHKNDVMALGKLGDYIRSRYRHNLADNGKVIYTGELADTDDCLVRTADGHTELEIDVVFEEMTDISRVVLEENTAYSQRIEEFFIKAEQGGELKTVYYGTTVGYRKIAAFDNVTTRHLKICITDARESICLNKLGIYE